MKLKGLAVLSRMFPALSFSVKGCISTRVLQLVRMGVCAARDFQTSVISVTGIVGKIWSRQRKYSPGQSQVSNAGRSDSISDGILQSPTRR
jgi:hypothetical protein